MHLKSKKFTKQVVNEISGPYSWRNHVKKHEVNCPALTLPTWNEIIRTKLNGRVKGVKELKYHPNSFKNF